MFDRRDCRECTRIIQHQLAPIFPPPLLEIPHYRRPVIVPENIRWLEQHQREEWGYLHNVLPQSTPLTRGVQESQPVDESSFRPSFALETGDQEDHVLFTPLSYREDYGEDYGEDYSEDYSEDDGEDYAEDYGEDYGEEDDVSLNDFNVKIKYNRPSES
ncbi:hypothetical protein Bpfe_028742 [Biomphalaria pfeifferi]|uniref:Uncharacterized protein n=1 Tax=Biomphalaria pfeifferi TaxID=112525 RepID=A0AAD8AUE2_BIOPF|nr:hypothetical protein Bpfe_028742 [Biomphalaria pfeifferi]